MPDVSIEASWKDILPANIYWLCYAGAAVLLAVILYILHEKTLSPQISSPVDAEGLGR